MAKTARIRFESSGLHEFHYGLAVGAAVLFELGLLVGWFNLYGLVKTGPGPSVPMPVAFPELYYSSIVAGVVGGLALAAFLIIATYRWLRGIQFTLSELILLALATSLALLRCTSDATLSSASYAAAVLYPLLYKFFPSLVQNANWQGSAGFNVTINSVHAAVMVAFLLGLWARIPARQKIAKLGALILLVLLWFTCGTFVLFSLAPAFALPALLVCGLATRDPVTEVFKFAAAFTHPRRPHHAKVPPPPQSAI